MNKSHQTTTNQSDPETIKPILYLKDLEHFHPKNHLGSDKTLFEDINSKNDNVDSKGYVLKFLGRQMLDGFKQFLYEGSLHGVKYILEPKHTIQERLTWIVIMSASIVFCAINIHQLLLQSLSYPFVIVMDSLVTPVWAIPFPLVAICPQLHVKLSYANISEVDEITKFYASLVCPSISKKIKSFKDKLSPKQMVDLQNFIIDSAPKCTDVIKGCYWRGRNEEWMTNECCSSLFRPIFTSYGICYAFNHLPSKAMANATLSWQKTFDPDAKLSNLTWTLKEGYPNVFPLDPNIIPLRTMTSGEVNGLGVDLHTNISEHQHECDGNNFGFNVLIRSPIDHTYIRTALRLPMDRLTTIELTPVTYRTDDKLRNILPSRRQCKFEHERELEYFSWYTDTNCKQDHLIVETRKKCNCVPYNWPRKHLEEPICSTAEDFDCVETVSSNVEEQLIYAYFTESDKPSVIRDNGQNREPLYCYPACNDLLYYSKVFYSALSREQGHAFKASDIERGETTRIDVHFFEDTFLGLHRHAQYDELYFVGAVGGLLSLFMGFSIITIAELLWFTFLRPARRTLCVMLKNFH